jgi:esterase/lipase superfamily enzyme
LAALGFRKVLLTGLLCLASVGCSSIPQGLMEPVAVPSGNPRVSMLTATTRAPSDNRAELFNGDRGQGVSFNRVVVSLPKNREPGTIQWPQTTPGNPVTDFVVTSVDSIRRDQIANWFMSDSGKARRLFIYVHGFNTPYGQAVMRFAQLVHDSDADAAPALFTWPSRGKILDYKRDFDNATYSRNDLADLLKLALASPNVSEIVLLAHSMGSWPAMEAVTEVALRQGGVSPKFRNVILASPDLDIGVFRRQIESMGPRRPEITVFVSREDRALQLSRFLARSGPRLGGVDATAEEYRDKLKNFPKVTVFDVTELRSGDRINHSIYASSPEVVQLIGNRLIAGELDTSTEAGGPFSLVEGLGSAARLIVASPVLVLDAASQR